MSEIILNEQVEDIIFECLIAITKHGEGYIIDIPDKFESYLDGNNVEDNNFKEVPMEMGLYKCTVKYIYNRSYFDSDDDWYFKIIKAEKCSPK